MSLKEKWDQAFDNTGHVENAEHLLTTWANAATRYRAQSIALNRKIELDIQYGEKPQARLDLVWPDTTPTGLAIFVHGGYWIRLDKSYWTDLAEGMRAHGYAFCIPGYTLAPEATISEITKQIGQAITKAASLVDGPIYLFGHSAGGHLVSRMVCQDSPLSNHIHARLAHTVSISGLHDLRPLLHTSMNEKLKLDASEAFTESAALQLPRKNTHFSAWVGGNERPEFIRQAKLIAMIWEGLNVKVDYTVDAHHNHFTVIEGLKNSKSAIIKQILRDH